MDQTIVIFALCFLQTTAFIPHNGSIGPRPRTFGGHYVTVTEESIREFFDLPESSSELDDEYSGSGSGPVTVEGPVTHYDTKKQFRLSPKAKEFLQGNLSTVVVPTVYSFVVLISVPLNLAAVIMFLRRKRPRKTGVIYMLNLAFADLLFVLALPLKIAYHYQGNNWVFGGLLCRVVTAAFYCNMYCSVLLMTCISVDRFLAVVYPLDALTWRRPRTAYATCAAMWLLALGGVAPLLISEQSVPLPELGITTCHDVQDTEQLRTYYLYFFPAYTCLFFFLPLVLTAVCYVRIVQTLAAANVGNGSRKSRAVMMAVAVLVVFVACFAPSNVLMMVHYLQLARHTAADASYLAYLVSTCVGTLSCCLDPLIYYFGSSQCQRQVMALLTCRDLAGVAAGSSRSASSRLSSGRRQTESTRSTKMESVQDRTLRDQCRKLVS
ncbi:unnamed protein product [Arctogadus glacialis]